MIRRKVTSGEKKVNETQNEIDNEINRIYV